MQTTALSKALTADLRQLEGRAGPMSYYVAGEGPPALLLHSINAAASAFEIKPVFDRLTTSRTVYAVDLPGYGLSDRSARHYDVTLFVNAVLDMLDAIQGDAPDSKIDGIALSLSAEFLARAARDTSYAWRSLTLITPTAFNAGSEKLRADEGETREMKLFSAIINAPLWRRGLFRTLVKPSVIRYFLRRTWGSDDIDHELARYCDETTHQPGAEHAPLAFLSGGLFSKDMRTVYESLTMPVWLAHGTRGDFKDFRGADWTEEKSNWRKTSFDTGAMPFFEQPEEFHQQLLEFLKSAQT